MGVDVDQRFHRRVAAGCPLATDQHTVRHLQIRDRRAFGEKLRVRQHLKREATGIRRQNVFNRFGGLHRNRGFLDDDLGPVGLFGNRPRDRLDKPQVRRATRADAVGLRRCVHRHKNNIRGANGLVDLGRKMQVLAACLPHDLIESGLVDRQRVRIPRGDAGGIHVDHPHFNFRCLEGDHRHRRTAHVTSANTTNFHTNSSPTFGHARRESKAEKRAGTRRPQITHDLVESFPSS